MCIVNLFRRAFLKELCVIQKNWEVEAGIEKLLFTLEFRKKTNNRSFKTAAPVVEVYSGCTRIWQGVQCRLDEVGSHHCDVYIYIKPGFHGRIEVKLKVNSNYALSKEHIFVDVIESEATKYIESSTSSSTVVRKYSNKTRKEDERSKLIDHKNSKTNYGFTRRVITTPTPSIERHSPPSAIHVSIEIISPCNGRVKAGEILSLKLIARYGNGREINDVHRKLALKLDNQSVNPSSTDSSRLNFHVRPTRAGKQCLSLSGYGQTRKWLVNVLPSDPYCLRKVTYTAESSPVDPSFQPDNQTLYHNVRTIFEAEIVDKFRNVVTNVNVVGVSSRASGIKFYTYSVTNGKLKIRMRACEARGTFAEMVIRLKCDDSSEETVLKKTVQVSHPPCSSRLSQVTSQDQVCIAGIEHKFNIIIKDVFDDQVPTGAGVNCIVYAWSFEPHFRTAEHNICTSDVIHITEDECSDGYLQLHLVIIPKRVGSRRIFVYLNGEQINTSDIQFQVNPNLNSLRCRSIRRLQSEGKPAMLEVSIEDCGGNTVPLGEAGDFRLVNMSGPPDSLTHQSTQIKSSVVLIEHTLMENKRYLLSLEKKTVTGYYTSIYTFEIDTHSDVLESNDPEDKQFLLYNDNFCQVVQVRGQWSGIHCRDIAETTMKGPDGAHVKNIKRVLSLNDDLNINEHRSRDETKITEIRFAPSVEQKFLETCRELLLHLLRGVHYRKKAAESGKRRVMWKERIERLEERNGFGIPDAHEVEPIPWSLEYCRGERDVYRDLTNKYNRQASEELFAFFNYKRETNEVDLHGLLVANEQNYAALRRTLMDKNVDDMVVEEIISRCRWEADEAIRKLQEKLESFEFEDARKNGEPWIEIIVGAGHHSRGNPKIRPKVERFLQERSTDFAPVNKGSLVVTLEKYGGPEPCVAEYYCERCHRCWKSNRSWSNTPQLCKICKETDGENVKCWPLKQRAEEKSSSCSSELARRSRAEMMHQVHLCKMCQTLGYPCYNFL